MKKVQVGFIGAGYFISCHHLLTVRDSKIMDIRAIADLDGKQLKKHASNMDIGYTTTDYKKLLADPEIDMIIIGTKQDLHARFIIECLDAGKWVLCEKPMSENDEETKAVLEAEKRNPGKLAIGFNRRFAPSYVDAKELMQQIPRPWYINYRLMNPIPGKKGEKSFYSTHERMLYEGSHILDMVSWFLEAVPKRVFMTGDKIRNNCCILDYEDGSQVSFMCGSMGSYSYWKESMEVFGEWSAITVSDFVDMRVRGIPDEYDRTYAPQMGEHAEEIKKFGFDFYEMYKVKWFYEKRDDFKKDCGIDIVPVKRPTEVPFDIADYKHENPDLYVFIPDKGWIWAVEHFAQCFLDGTEPGNADGRGGALATNLALALLKSLETGQAVEL